MNDQFITSLGRQLFSTVQLTAFGLSSLGDLYAFRGEMLHHGQKFSDTVPALADARIGKSRDSEKV